MKITSPEVIQCVVICLVVAMTTCHVHVLDDEDDFDYDYEDEDFDKPLKKPIPEPKNPIRDQKEFVADKEHMKEHMDYEWDEDDKSIEFAFFKTHDTNLDRKLDGLELYHAIEHSMGDQLDKIMEDAKITANLKKRRVERMYMQLEATIDRILRDDDNNKDGYLAYPEFANARAAASIVRQKPS